MPTGDLPTFQPFGDPPVNPFTHDFGVLLNATGEAAAEFRIIQPQLEEVIALVPHFRRQGGGGVTFTALITGAMPNGDNKWRYMWAEARIVPADDTLEIDPDGRTSEDDDQKEALNMAEVKNTATVAAHGVNLVSPDSTGVVAEIPGDTPVTMFFQGLDANGIRVHYFSEANAVNFTCEGSPGQVVPDPAPPDTRGIGERTDFET